MEFTILRFYHFTARLGKRRALNPRLAHRHQSRTKTVIHTNTFTQKQCHTQTALLLHTHTLALTLKSWDTDMCNTENFCAHKITPQTHKTASLPQFLTIEPHSVRKGYNRTLRIAILPQFLTIEPHFARKSCNNVDNHNRNFTSILNDRTSFRAKRLQPNVENRNFTTVFDDRTSFRAKRLHFVVPRWHCPVKREEGKREKMREDVRWDVKMRWCEDEKMWRDVKMRRWWEDIRWEDVRWDVKMRRCDEKMWWQTSTIRGTLRSDALGKKNAETCETRMLVRWYVLQTY